MDMVDISLCGLTFQAPPDWFFFPNDKFILARRNSYGGILRISQARRLKRQNPTAKDLLKSAEKVISQKNLPAPFQFKEPGQAFSLLGCASYKLREKKRDLFIRVYYLLKNGDFIAVAYGCPWSDRDTETVRDELSQCEKIVLTIKAAKYE